MKGKLGLGEPLCFRSCVPLQAPFCVVARVMLFFLCFGLAVSLLGAFLLDAEEEHYVISDLLCQEVE